MRNLLTYLALGACASLSHAAVAQGNEATLLQQTRAKYDVPFERKLNSFNCAVDFNWKQHWKETIRVGDEGSDDQIEKFIQPIRNRVTVTQKDAILSSGMSEEEEHKLPRGGMAEGLLKHAVRYSLRNWLVASNNALLPAIGTPVHFEQSTAGYTLQYKVQSFNVAMMLTRDMRLQSMEANGVAADRQEFEFRAGPQGFLLASWIMGEDGEFRAGNHLTFTYTYQQIDGFQVPEHVLLNRESHHEVWRYSLSDCKVITEK